jgi:hypothetical protein
MSRITLILLSFAAVLAVGCPPAPPKPLPPWPELDHQDPPPSNVQAPDWYTPPDRPHPWPMAPAPEFGTLAWRQWAAVRYNNRHVIPAVSPAPVIDGKLDEPAWKSAAFARPFRTARGEPAKPETTVHLACDDTKLYVGIRAAEPYLSKLQLVPKGRDTPVASGDHVLVALCPNWRDAERTVYRLAVNANAAILDTRNGDGRWNPEIAVDAAKADKEWTAEVSVPLTAFGVKPGEVHGQIWACAVIRQRVSADESGISSWTRVAGTGPDGANWGHVLFKGLRAKETPKPEPKPPAPEPEPEPKPEPPDAGTP